MGASKPTRASYLDHVPKARIEEMISEDCGAGIPQRSGAA
jgi:hypothetical protein